MQLAEELQQELADFRLGGEKYAVHVVELLLKLALARRASDLHLLPDESRSRLVVHFRIDGVLEPAGEIPGAVNIISRLKVLANLLTYRTDVPQEGRVKAPTTQEEIRISTFPTLHGEKAVVRLFVGSGEFRHLRDLGYPPEIQGELEFILQRTSGLLLACGPSGSGKTTTLYACLRQIQQDTANLKSICTLEDPVEAIVAGVSQSLIKPETEFNYQRGLVSLMRQDPDVIMVGEIRDRETAEIVFQASLTGHLVLSTFHAGTTADALGRLAEMSIEPYILRSGLTALLAQRLLRKACACQVTSKNHVFGNVQKPTACIECRQTGYLGRIVAAELLKIDSPEITNAILHRRDVPTIAKCARDGGMTPMWEYASRMAAQQITTVEECLRVFGPEFQLERLSEIAHP